MLQAQLDPLAPLDLRVLKGLEGYKAPQGQQALKEKRDRKGFKVHKVLSGFEALKG